MWSINVNLRLLKAVDFVGDVNVMLVMLFVVVVVFIVVKVVDVALLVVKGHIIFSCGQ